MQVHLPRQWNPGRITREAERSRRLQEGGDYKQPYRENNGLFNPICQHVNDITALSTSGIEPFTPSFQVINMYIHLERRGQQLNNAAPPTLIESLMPLRSASMSCFAPMLCLCRQPA